MKENQIQKYILDRLNANNIFNFKIVATNKRGIPDIFFLYKGVPYFIEVKTNKGKLSDLQKYQIEKISDNGGWAKVVKSIKEFDSLLDYLINN